MRAKNLKGCLAATKKKEKEKAAREEKTMESNRGGGDTEATSTEASNWVMVVELVQIALR